MKLSKTRARRALGLGLVAASAAGWGVTRSAEAEVTRDRNSGLERAPAGHVSTLRFEQNVGQFEENVRFLARGKGYAFHVTREGATMAFGRDTLTMRIVGGRSVEPLGQTELPGANNYFVGGDSKRWQTGAPSYASVQVDDVLPGVSLVYYGNVGRDLEYDLILAAGRAPGSIELSFEGLESMRLEADGSVVLRLPSGAELRKPAPVAYQTNAAGERVTVASRYALHRGNRLGFMLGDYDESRSLRIDPVLQYSTYLGGSSFDQAFGVASDASGNSYVVGYTSSSFFPTVAPLQPQLAGGVYDVFVCKLNASGSIVYSTFLGGHGADLGYAIAADAQGNAYVTGVTYSTDFPVVSAVQANAAGKQDAFVAKLNAQGSALVYSTYFGGSQDDYAQGIAVDAAGKAFLVGTTFSSNFPQLGALQGALSGTSDAFVSALSLAGSSLAYSTYLGGSGGEYGHGITLDTSENAVVVGSTASSNFPLSSPLQASYGGGAYDAFVSKLNASGSAFVFSTYLGGAFTDEGNAVANHLSGSITVAGYTSSNNFPVLNAVQPTLASAGHTDAFVSRLTSSGSALSYSTYLGGSADDSANGVGVDSSNTAYVVGSTESGNFPVVKPLANQAAYSGLVDGFVTALDPTGSPVTYSTYLGGNDEDRAVAVSVQAIGTTHIVGNTQSTNFPVQSAPIASLVGFQDAFVTRLPGLSVVAPASSLWSLLLLGGFLLGCGLLLPAPRKRLA